MTGHICSYDTSKFREASVEQETVGEIVVEEAFIVTIPRFLHNEPKCLEAKEKELVCWEDFNVYEEVPDDGQKTLGTSCMLVEKIIDGELSVKARLCVRGDQEISEFRTDSPTVHKNSMNIFFMIASKNK